MNILDNKLILEFYLSSRYMYPYEVAVPLKNDVRPEVYEKTTMRIFCRVPFYARTLFAHAVWMFKTRKGLEEFLQYRENNAFTALSHS